MKKKVVEKEKQSWRPIEDSIKTLFALKRKFSQSDDFARLMAQNVTMQVPIETGSLKNREAVDDAR